MMKTTTTFQQQPTRLRKWLRMAMIVVMTCMSVSAFGQASYSSQAYAEVYPSGQKVIYDGQKIEWNSYGNADKAPLSYPPCLPTPDNTSYTGANGSTITANIPSSREYNPSWSKDNDHYVVNYRLTADDVIKAQSTGLTVNYLNMIQNATMDGSFTGTAIERGERFDNPYPMYINIPAEWGKSTTKPWVKNIMLKDRAITAPSSEIVLGDKWVIQDGYSHSVYIGDTGQEGLTIVIPEDAVAALRGGGEYWIPFKFLVEYRQEASDMFTRSSSSTVDGLTTHNLTTTYTSGLPVEKEPILIYGWAHIFYDAYPAELHFQYQVTEDSKIYTSTKTDEEYNFVKEISSGTTTFTNVATPDNNKNAVQYTIEEKLADGTWGTTTATIDQSTAQASGLVPGKTYKITGHQDWDSTNDRLATNTYYTIEIRQAAAGRYIAGIHSSSGKPESGGGTNNTVVPGCPITFGASGGMMDIMGYRTAEPVTDKTQSILDNKSFNEIYNVQVLRGKDPVTEYIGRGIPTKGTYYKFSPTESDKLLVVAIELHKRNRFFVVRETKGDPGDGSEMTELGSGIETWRDVRGTVTIKTNSAYNYYLFSPDEPLGLLGYEYTDNTRNYDILSCGVIKAKPYGYVYQKMASCVCNEADFSGLTDLSSVAFNSDWASNTPNLRYVYLNQGQAYSTNTYILPVTDLNPQVVLAFKNYSTATAYTPWTNSNYFALMRTSTIGAPYICSKPVLNDSEQFDFVIPNNYTLFASGGNITYNRTGLKQYPTTAERHYSTICLPFDVSTLPDGFVFEELKSVTDETATFQKVTSLEKGKPYIFYNKSSATGNLTLTNAPHSHTSSNSIAREPDYSNSNFQGTFVNIIERDLHAETANLPNAASGYVPYDQANTATAAGTTTAAIHAETNAFFTTINTGGTQGFFIKPQGKVDWIKYADKNVWVRPFRAFFRFPTSYATDGEPDGNSEIVNAKSLTCIHLDEFGNEETTDIITPESFDFVPEVDVYTLNGVKVASNVAADHALDNLPRGIYILSNGKKMAK